MTIGREIQFRGIGVHSGKIVNLALKPSESGSIVFRRTDLDGREMGLDPRVTDARNSSILGSGDFRIETVEHLMASLSAFGVGSVLIELDGAEIPILDGSALPFCEALAKTGLRPAGSAERVLRVVSPFKVESGDASIEVFPDPGFRIHYHIEFDHPSIGGQDLDLVVTRDAFVEGIAPARTFGFLKDVPELRRKGLALGGSFANALILDDEKVVNGPLRFPDEFVRHKILDLIGDLYILGRPVSGHFRARKAGHALHLRAVAFLLDHPEVRTFSD